MRSVAAVLALVPALAAAAPGIVAVSVKPNPAPFDGKGSEVVISVSIERPTPLDLTCEATVDPGDGGRARELSWAVGDRRTKTTRHEYRKPGTYRLRVSGSGKDPCAGTREVTVSIGGTAQPAAAPAGAQCPAGWTLVAESVKGARYTCRVKPPALTCPAGTKYFAGKGELGCR